MARATSTRPASGPGAPGAIRAGSVKGIGGPGSTRAGSVKGIGAPGATRACSAGGAGVPRATPAGSLSPSIGGGQLGVGYAHRFEGGATMCNQRGPVLRAICLLAALAVGCTPSEDGPADAGGGVTDGGDSGSAPDDAGGAVDAAADGDGGMPSETACCAANLICALCRCTPAEQRLVADNDPASCAELLDARPETCPLPPNPEGREMLSRAEATAYCDSAPVDGYGGPCAGCAEDICVDTADGGRCSQACGAFGPGCPSGAICVGVCVAPGPMVFGEVCREDADCRSLQCDSALGVCTWLCDDDDACPASHPCSVDHDGPGRCRGDAAVGQGCARDFDCADSACVDGICTVTGGGFGESCQSGSDCASEICATFAVGEPGICTRECDAVDDPCPPGWTCLPGQPALCVPQPEQ